MSPEQKAEFEARFAAENEQVNPEFAARMAAEDAATREKMLNPAGSALLGAAGAQALGRIANLYGKGTEATLEGLIKRYNVPEDVVSKGSNAVINYIRSQHTGDIGYVGGEDYKRAHALTERAKELSEKAPLGYKYDFEAGQYIPEDEFNKRQAARDAVERARIAAERKNLPAVVRIAEKSPGTARAVLGAENILRGGLPPFAGRTIAGGFGGYSGAEAYNRAIQGDVPGAIISGTGAVGSAMSLSPDPKKRAIGIGSALLSAIADRLYTSPTVESPGGLDTIKNVSDALFNTTPPTTRAAGGAIPGYAGGGLAYLSKGKKVMEAFEYGGKQLGKLSDWAQDYIGSYFVPTQSDRMRYVGGPSFSANQLARPEYKDIVWGSGKPGTATGIANLAKDPRFGGVENQIFAPLLGEAKMHQSNKMIFDRMVEEFFRNPEKLTPELRQTINDYIRSGGLTVGGAKKSKSFEPIPEFDVADRQMIETLGKTFDNRKLIAQHAFGGKDIGGRKSQIIPYEKILQETTDPTVLGAPTFSMGPRAFKLTGETLDVPRPDLNAAFPYKLFGQDLGVTYPPVPSELSLMDFQRQWRQDTGKTMPRKSGALPQPGYYEHTMGYTPAGSSERIYPRQKMTENWVKELQRSGFNEGGLT